MTKKNNKKINYRQLKKELNQYHNFSFKMPRKGKDFSGHQKAAITIRYKLLTGQYLKRQRTNLLKSVNNNKISFIRYPKRSKLPGVDGYRTNKGIFYKFPGAKTKIKKVGGRKKHIIEINFMQIKGEEFIPFPPKIINDPLQIDAFIQILIRRYKPKNVRLAINGGRGSHMYTSKTLSYYISELIKYSDKRELNKLRKSGAEATYINKKTSVAGIPYFNGVFLEY